MLCKVCGVTDGALFYKGVAKYCKAHWKARARANRIAKIEHYREYDRARAAMPHRMKLNREIAARWRGKNPDRRKAQITLLNALRDGRAQRYPCLVCGSKAEAHHPDYSRPLDVVWLCRPHHMQTHAMVKKV